MSYNDLEKSEPRVHESQQFFQAIREVMSQQRQEYSLEYPCHSPLEKCWFNLRITRFQGDAPDWIVVSHENITERKQAELALLHSVKELELAYQQSVIYTRELRGEITARKRAEESLRLSQAQLLLLIEQAPLSIAMFDREMLTPPTMSRQSIRLFKSGRIDILKLSSCPSITNTLTKKAARRRCTRA